MGITQIDPRVDRAAKLQLGLLTRRQSLVLLGRRRTERWLLSGRLVVVHPTVYRLAGAPETWHQSLLAAVLAAGPGAVASHRAAAYLWGLIDEQPPIEISVPFPRLPRLVGVIVHRSRDVHRATVHMRDAIPTTSPMRALVDIGAVMTRFEVSDALERGLTKKLFTIAAVEWALNEVAKRGRIGGGVLRKILDERALGSRPADGLLEPRFARLATVYDLPPYEFQHPFGRYRVDFAWPALLLAVEVDGWEAHSSPEALQRDLDRQNALVAAGWTVLRFTWHDVVRRPAMVARQIHSVLCALRPA